MPKIEPVISREELMKARQRVEAIYMDDKLKSYIVEVVMTTRNPGESGLGRLENLIRVGASPRATINLTKAARAHAFLRSRGYVTVDDIKAVAYHVLRHTD